MKSRMVRLLAAVACGLLSLSLVAGGTGVLTAQASETEDAEPEEEAEGDPYEVSVEIPVSVEVDGDGAPEEEFTVVLEALGDANPVPSVTELSAAAGEEVSFGPIVYTTPGDYKYTLTLTAGSTDYMTYDDTVIYVTVRVQNNDSYTGLVATIWGYEDEDDETNETEKLSEFSFTNSYYEPTETTVELTKEVSTSEDSGFGASVTAKVGSTVYFQATVTVIEGAHNYVLHDEMGSGLTFDAGSLAVSVDDEVLVKGTDYTLETDPDDDCTFEVYIVNDSLETLSVGDIITVSYSAVVNSSAVVEGDGNINEITLTYSDPYIWILTEEEVEREIGPEDAVVYRPSSTTTTTTTTTTSTGTTVTYYYYTTVEAEAEEEEAGEVLGDSVEPEVVVEEEEAGEVLAAEKLPQTGQTKWPVPVMAVAGIILFGCGFTLVKKENEKELRERR